MDTKLKSRLETELNKKFASDRVPIIVETKLPTVPDTASPESDNVQPYPTNADIEFVDFSVIPPETLKKLIQCLKYLLRSSTNEQDQN